MSSDQKFDLRLISTKESEETITLNIDSFTTFQEINSIIQEKEDSHLENYDLTYFKIKLNYYNWKDLPFYKFLQIFGINVRNLSAFDFIYQKAERQASDYSFSSYVGHMNKYVPRKFLTREENSNFVGLINSGNTCYLNSLLQALFMTPEFRNEIYSWDLDEDSKENLNLCIPYQLQKIFCQLQFSSKYSIDTIGLTKSFRWVDENILEQQDIHELCRIMFDALEKKMTKNKARIRKSSECIDTIKSQNSMQIGTPTRVINMEKNNKCFINRYFGGKRSSYVKCDKCKKFSFNDEEILDIQVPLTTFETDSKKLNNLIEAFEMMEAEETLEKENLYYCENCKKMNEAKRGSIFTEMPYILSLQLLRFTFNFTDLSKIKLQHRFEFPVDEFDCSKFVKTKEDLIKLYQEKCDSDKVDSGLNSSPSSDVEEDVAMKLFNSCSESIENTSENSIKTPQKVSEGKTKHVYQLFSIMVHSGTVNKGHYYSYIKNFEDSEWYCFNDQDVTKVSLDRIEDTFGSENSSRSAYFLWYRRVDPNLNQKFFTKDNLKKDLLQMVKSMNYEEDVERAAIQYTKNVVSVCIWQGKYMHDVELNKEDVLSNAAVLAAKKIKLYSPNKKYRLVLVDKNFKIIGSSKEIWAKIIKENSCVDTEQSLNYDSMIKVEEALSIDSDVKFILEEIDQNMKFRDYDESGYTFRVLPIQSELSETEDFNWEETKDLEKFSIGHIWSSRDSSFLQLFRNIFQHYPISSTKKIKGIIDVLTMKKTFSKKFNLIEISRCELKLEDLIEIDHQPINIYLHEVTESETNIVEERICCMILMYHHFKETIFFYDNENLLKSELDFLRELDRKNAKLSNMSLIDEAIEVMDVDDEDSCSYVYEIGLDHVNNLYQKKKLTSVKTSDNYTHVKIFHPKGVSSEEAFRDFFMDRHCVSENMLNNLKININNMNKVTFQFSVRKITVTIVDNCSILKRPTLKTKLKLNDEDLDSSEYYKRPTFIWPRLISLIMEAPITEEKIVKSTQQKILELLKCDKSILEHYELIKSSAHDNHYYLHLFDSPKGDYLVRMIMFLPEECRFHQVKTLMSNKLERISDLVYEEISRVKNDADDDKLLLAILDFPYLIHSHNISYNNSLFDLKWMEIKCSDDLSKHLDFEKISQDNSCILYSFKKNLDREKSKKDEIKFESKILNYCHKILNKSLSYECKYP